MSIPRRTPFRFVLPAAIILLAVAVRIARFHLAGIEAPVMAPWSGQVIFGFYFAVLVVGIQSLQGQFAAGRAGDPSQALLLLILATVSSDLVLVNIQETVATNDASYGPVVIWDTLTFFVWFRVVDLCRPGESPQFYAAGSVAIAPLFKLGREILFLPYEPFSARAYLDLAFGDCLVCLWAFIALNPTAGVEAGNKANRSHPRLRLLVFAGCVYWCINALENLANLAWAPIETALPAALDGLGLPHYSLSLIYFAAALAAAVVVRRWNVFGLGHRFGIAAARPTPLDRN